LKFQLVGLVPFSLWEKLNNSQARANLTCGNIFKGTEFGNPERVVPAVAVPVIFGP